MVFFSGLFLVVFVGVCMKGVLFWFYVFGCIYGDSLELVIECIV